MPHTPLETHPSRGNAAVSWDQDLPNAGATLDTLSPSSLHLSLILPSGCKGGSCSAQLTQDTLSTSPIESKFEIKRIHAYTCCQAVHQEALGSPQSLFPKVPGAHLLSVRQIEYQCTDQEVGRLLLTCADQPPMVHPHALVIGVGVHGVSQKLKFYTDDDVSQRNHEST